MSKKERRELIKVLLDRLEKLVSTMDVPVYKRRSVAWLQKNLSDRNQSHKNYQEAITIVDELVQHGVSHG